MGSPLWCGFKFRNRGVGFGVKGFSSWILEWVFSPGLRSAVWDVGLGIWELRFGV